MTQPAHVEHHFQDIEQQADAARLGMWVFLASELLLFAALFALFLTYRGLYPAGFAAGVAHNTKVFGSVNTGVLLVSSALVASAVHALREGRARRAAWLVAGTMLLGLSFLVIKVTEYGLHFAEGILPGGKGAFFAQHSEEGLPVFWTLYYLMTGLHAVHVTVGLGILAFMGAGIRRGAVRRAMAHRLELGAIYWHLIDVIWIFLWPLYYLA
jgi:cytochrome c oxidase subunit 3